MNDPIIQRTAKLILIAIHDLDARKRGELRGSFDKTALKVLSGEKIITDGFIAALEDEFATLGWLMFDNYNNGWSVIHGRTICGMVKVGISRLERDRLLSKSADEVQEVYDKLYPDEDDQEKVD